MKLIIRWRPLALWGLFLLAFLLRLYGLNWDQGNSFHPDERQILFHVVALAWPTSLAQFLDPVHSPLNPHFFAYGSFPIYFLALLGAILHYNPGDPATFMKLTLLGRGVSALLDSATVLLTGWLALRLVYDTRPGRPAAWNVALLAAALVAFTPFQIQLAHFYAVDSMLLFFVMLTLLACVTLVDTEKPLRWTLLTGIGYGLAVGTKFSAAPLVVPVLVALGLRFYRRREAFDACLLLVFSGSITLLLFLVTNPYALLDFQNFREQLTEQSDQARGLLDLPFTRQFAGTIPYVYEIQNMVLWGLGIALGVAALLGLLWLLWRAWKRDAGIWLVLLSWVLVYTAIVGSFYDKFMRYMLPVYPPLTLMAAAVLLFFAHRAADLNQQQLPRWRRIAPYLGKGAIVIVLAGTIFQGLALLNVYSQPNTRIQASIWIYQHIPAGSTLTYEQWDDPLPVMANGHSPDEYIQGTYRDTQGNLTTGLDLYDPDTRQKAQQLAQFLPTVNAITMATDRLDKSIPRLPARYPLTIHYYQLLFSGQLGFRLAATFEVRPNLLGIKLDDSNADESYSVFDHPHVRVFVRETPYPYTAKQLLQKLLTGVQLPLSD